jgi:predicted MFS family arabinose efflux permease
MTPAPALPPVFHRLAGANLAAQAAEQISLAAVPIVAVLSLGAGAAQIGSLAVAQTLPFLLLSLPLGVWVDRVSRRRIMVLAEALRTLAFVGLLLASATGQVSLPLLALLGFLGATGTVAFSVAAPALVPTLVPREGLAAANGRIELARSAAHAAGPALAGALVAWAGASLAFVVAAMLSTAALVLLRQLPEGAPTSPGSKRHPLREVQAGAAWVWQHRLLRPVLVTAVVWNVSWFMLQAAYVPYAMRALGLSASQVGITLACFGVGMLVGALAAPLALRHLSYGHVVVLGPLVSVLAMLSMVLTLALVPASVPGTASTASAAQGLFSPAGAAAALSFFLFGAGPIVWTIATTTLRQSVTPGAMLGRVSALFLTFNAGARPLGAALGAAVSAAVATRLGGPAGEAACLWLALAGFVLQAGLVWASPIRTLVVLPTAAAA